MREQRGLRAARARADLEDRVLLVVRVARDQEQADLLLELRAARLELGDLALRELAQLGVALGEHRLRALEVGQELAVLGGGVGRRAAGPASSLASFAYSAGLAATAGLGEALLELRGAVRERLDLRQQFGHGEPGSRGRQEFIDARNSSFVSLILTFSSRNSIESTGFSGASTLRRMYMRLSVASVIKSSSRRVADRLMSIAG